MPKFDSQVRRKNSFLTINQVTTNANPVSLYCIHPRLKQDIRSMFFLNYFGFRQVISQLAILVVTTGGCFETPPISEGRFEILVSSRRLR